MGADKALLPLGDLSVIEHVLRRLQPMVAGLYLVVNKPEPYRFLNVPLVQDITPGQGPLMGLYSGLRACPAPWALAVACDTPFLEPGLLQALVDRRGATPVVVPVIKGNPQPLPGLYSTDCIATIERLLREGHRALRDLLGAAPLMLLPETQVRSLDPELRSFVDLDTLEQLHQARRLVESGDVE